MWENINKCITKKAVIIPIHNWRRWISVAAAVFLLLFIGSYLLLRNGTGQSLITKTSNYDIAPGGNKAILTLANGKTIILTNSQNGTIATQGSTKVTKTQDGQVTYASSGKAEHTVRYNTICTPRGGEYNVVLADGSKVWLNAASSITYPTVFNGTNREVTITGEAYFEVAHNKNKPFIVVSNGQKIQVLGTHFDVNAYADEPGTTTTLLEGSVKVSSHNIIKIIRPGQQAYLVNNQISVTEANTAGAIAWKNGYFKFNNDNIESIMRQLARWYDIDVSYQGQTSGIGFYGRISRSKNISQVLNMLEKTNGVHFEIGERRIIVKE